MQGAQESHHKISLWLLDFTSWRVSHQVVLALLLGFKSAHLLCAEVCDWVLTEDLDCTEVTLAPEDCKLVVSTFFSSSLASLYRPVKRIVW